MKAGLGVLEKKADAHSFAPHHGSLKVFPVY